MMITVNKTIKFRSNGGDDNGEIELASNNAQVGHLNIYMRGSREGVHGGYSFCAHPDDAKALRDALNEIYPTVPVPSVRYSPYQIRKSDDGFDISRDKFELTERKSMESPIAYFDHREHVELVLAHIEAS